MLKDLRDSINQVYTKDIWLDTINYYFEYLPGLASHVEDIWSYVLNTKRSKDENRVNGYKLIAINTTYEDYVKAVGIDVSP